MCLARYFLIKHRMLPIDVQREIVFAFKTRILSQLPEIGEAEKRAKEEILRLMIDGCKFDDGARQSLHLFTLQKQFLESMLAFDATAAEQHLQEYKRASQAQLDCLVFRENKVAFVAVCGWDSAPLSMHTGDDEMAVVYGDTVKANVDAMRTGLDVLKGLRKTCLVAV